MQTAPNKEVLRQQMEERIWRFLLSFREEHQLPPLWRRPLIGFAAYRPPRLSQAAPGRAAGPCFAPGYSPRLPHGCGVFSSLFPGGNKKQPGRTLCLPSVGDGLPALGSGPGPCGPADSGPSLKGRASGPSFPRTPATPPPAFTKAAGPTGTSPSWPVWAPSESTTCSSPPKAAAATIPR